VHILFNKTWQIFLQVLNFSSVMQSEKTASVAKNKFKLNLLVFQLHTMPEVFDYPIRSNILYELVQVNFIIKFLLFSFQLILTFHRCTARFMNIFFFSCVFKLNISGSGFCLSTSSIRHLVGLLYLKLPLRFYHVLETYIYTVSQKKGTPILLPITQPNIDRF
jgi:hypothetical protein